MRIVFLDIDGVIHPLRIPYSEETVKAAFFSERDGDTDASASTVSALVEGFDHDCVARLVDLVESTGSRIVVHSSWGRFIPYLTRSVLKHPKVDLWRLTHGVWVTPKKLSATKRQEIGFWLTDAIEFGEPIEGVVVLEDEDLGIPHQVLVEDPSVGFQNVDLERARKVLLTEVKFKL